MNNDNAKNEEVSIYQCLSLLAVIPVVALTNGVGGLEKKCTHSTPSFKIHSDMCSQNLSPKICEATTITR